MGEIADRILDGMYCGWCGKFVNEDPPGFPVLCDGCDDIEIAEQIEEFKRENNENT